VLSEHDILWVGSNCDGLSPQVVLPCDNDGDLLSRAYLGVL
jgi:hypothetical protein